VTERVGAEVAADLACLHALVVVDREQRVGGGREVGARVEGDGREVGVDLGEHVRQRADRHTGLAGHQPQRRDPVLQVGEHRAAGRVHVGVGVALADVPAGGDRAVRRAAPGERGEAGEAGVGSRVVGRVEGPDREPVVGRAREKVLHRAVVAVDVHS
jgi:hypothetical protein